MGNFRGGGLIFGVTFVGAGKFSRVTFGSGANFAWVAFTGSGRIFAWVTLRGGANFPGKVFRGGLIFAWWA